MNVLSPTLVSPIVMTLLVIMVSFTFLFHKLCNETGKKKENEKSVKEVLSLTIFATSLDLIILGAD